MDEEEEEKCDRFLYHLKCFKIVINHLPRKFRFLYIPLLSQNLECVFSLGKTLHVSTLDIQECELLHCMA
jgi:hypothetical protein